MLNKCARVDSVILAGKRDSRRHPATSFSENVVLTKTSYRNVSSFIILRSEEALSDFNKNDLANFAADKKENKVFW